MADRSAGNGLRADALRNRDRILAAAHDLFLALGVDAPLDRIAARAGVGNATLYRRFPTRAELVKHVVIDSLDRLRIHAADAMAAPGSPWDALVRFCRDVVDKRLVAMLPILGPHVEPDAEFAAARRGLVAVLEALLASAREAGDLRDDVDLGDVIMILATVTRPLPGVSEDFTAAVQHRHLGLLLAGLHNDGVGELPGRPISVDDLTAGVLAGRRSPEPQN